MGDETQREQRRQDFAPFQVHAGMMAVADPRAILLHCLPAHRGEEVTDEVMDAPQSAVFDQAENRLHAHKAILLWLLRKPREPGPIPQLRGVARAPGPSHHSLCNDLMAAPPTHCEKSGSSDMLLTPAPGSVLISMGKTSVLCTASVAAEVPPWLAGKGRGWITAEYGMLPGSTAPRSSRPRQKLDGRTTEIQRLIGRSIRAVADLVALGERTITVDCDVLYADGGTRTASITAAFLAVLDALQSLEDPRFQDAFPLRSSVAAVSVGIVDGQARLDLPYCEDVAASVDMNVVMTGDGQFVEVQGTGEEATFSETQLADLLALAKQGIQQLTQVQRGALGSDWPFQTG